MQSPSHFMFTLSQKKEILPAFFLVMSVIVIWFVFYAPIYMSFSNMAWIRAENSHAPLVIVILMAALGYQLCSIPMKRHVLLRRKNGWIDDGIGFSLLGFGIILYSIGRLNDVELFLSFSQMPILVGLITIFGSMRYWRVLWFPIALSFYLIIFPGWILDSLTAPLKYWISDAVIWMLQHFSNIPAAQAGVVLAIGQYELLIADACSGLNSMISLTMIGLIYLYVVKLISIMRNVFTMLLIVPIAILANICRVLILCLLTYYFGHDIGQGFMHDFAGFFMFGFALACIFAVDKIIDIWQSQDQSVDNGYVVESSYVGMA